jgi:Xaa-Pro dipeptidase
MRTVYLGRPPTEVERTSAVVAEALEAAIDRIRPGAVAADVDRAARARLAKDGLSISHRSGYSMGILFVPTPTEWRRDLLPDAAWALEPGMVFHVILLAPSGVGHSEMVLVTEEGHEFLTHLDRRLFVK